MEKQIKKLPSIIAKRDLKATGTLHHYVVGKPGDEVSGGIYLDKTIQLPCELTITFLIGEKEHKEIKEMEVEE